MGTRQRRRLLHAVCSLLPPEDARAILAGPLDDYGTFVQAYLDARRVGSLPLGLRRALLSAIFEMMDAETEQVLVARLSGGR